MQASHSSSRGAAVRASMQVSLPATEHVLAELGSIYPAFAYWACEQAAEEEDPSPAGPESQAEELDEVIFAGIVAMR